MNRIIIIFLMAGFFGTSAQSTEQNSVKQTFTSYKKAILDGHGSEAVKWVDKNTLSYYEKMLAVTLNGDSAEVTALPLMDKLTVLSLRHRIPKNDIKNFDGKQLFVYSIDKGMVGKNSVMNVDIGEVKVEGNSADGQLVSNGQGSPLYFGFSKEEGQWKLDLTSLFGPTTEGLKKMLSDQGMTENQFIFQALEMMSGKPVTNEIWSP